jgi:hypothetical protein
MYMYIEKTRQGYRITTYSAIDEKTHYIGYTKKQAIQKHKQAYNLRYKHLTIIEF